MSLLNIFSVNFMKSNHRVIGSSVKKYVHTNVGVSRSQHLCGCVYDTYELPGSVCVVCGCAHQMLLALKHWYFVILHDNSNGEIMKRRLMEGGKKEMVGFNLPIESIRLVCGRV
jgi:hypothetical protein